MTNEKFKPFDVDSCEQGCNDEYYSAEANCHETYDKCVRDGVLSREECGERRRRCLSAAETRVDACIENCRQLWVAFRDTRRN